MTRLVLLVLLAAIVVRCEGNAAISRESPPNGGWNPSWVSGGDGVVFESAPWHLPVDLFYLDRASGKIRRLTTGGAHLVTLLPGNRAVFYTRRNGKLEYRTIDPEKGIEEPLAVLSHDDLDPAWSPDGTKIAYVKRGEYRDLWIRDTRTGSTRQVTMNFHVREPRWSPDGSRIAFIIGRDQGMGIWMYHEPKKRLSVVHSGPVKSFAWAPDGSRLLLNFPRHGKDHRLLLVDLGTGKRTVLAPTWGDGAPPAWSADGKRIYFTGSGKGKEGIWRIEPGGEPEKAKPVRIAGFHATRPVLSPRGDRLLVEVKAPRGAVSEIWEYPIATAAGGADGKQLVASLPSRWGFLPAPDGKSGVFVSDESGKPLLMLARGGKEIRLLDLSGYGAPQVRWSADGKSLFAALDTEVVNLDLSGEEPKARRWRSDHPIKGAASGAGAWGIVKQGEKSNELLILDDLRKSPHPGTISPRKIPVEGFLHPIPPVWHPTVPDTLFLWQDGEIWRYSIKEGKGEQLTRLEKRIGRKGYFPGLLAISQDGSSVAFTLFRRGDNAGGSGTKRWFLRLVNKFAFFPEYERHELWLLSLPKKKLSAIWGEAIRSEFTYFWPTLTFPPSFTGSGLILSAMGEDLLPGIWLVDPAGRSRKVASDGVMPAIRGDQVIFTRFLGNRELLWSVPFAGGEGAGGEGKEWTP